MKNAAATACIRELCALGLAGELLIPALLEALHRAIPSARNLFDWVNADGSISRYYFEGRSTRPGACTSESHNKREAEAMPRRVDVIHSSVTIRSAENSTIGAFRLGLKRDLAPAAPALPARSHRAAARPGDRFTGAVPRKGDGIFSRADERRSRPSLLSRTGSAAAQN
jgi:hypothetical protein